MNLSEEMFERLVLSVKASNPTSSEVLVGVEEIHTLREIFGCVLSRNADLENNRRVSVKVGKVTFVYIGNAQYY